MRVTTAQRSCVQIYQAQQQRISVSAFGSIKEINQGGRSTDWIVIQPLLTTQSSPVRYIRISKSMLNRKKRSEFFQSGSQSADLCRRGRCVVQEKRNFTQAHASFHVPSLFAQQGSDPNNWECFFLVSASKCIRDCIILCVCDNFVQMYMSTRALLVIQLSLRKSISLYNYL